MPDRSPYMGPSIDEEKQMLETLNINSIDELIDKAVPKHLQIKQKLNLPEPLTELEITAYLNELSKKNADINTKISFLGGGYYDHFVPAIVDDIISKPDFYTAYTPYQAEISQGTLQAIFEYQTLISRLTGMEISNASMYDGASSTAESALLSVRYTGRKKILYSSTLNPLYVQVLKTYLHPNGIELESISHIDGRLDIDDLKLKLNDKVAGVILQNPNFYGVIENPIGLSDVIHKVGALFLCVVNPISLGYLKPPGEYGADVVTGEGQSLGLHQNFGGPGLGIFASRKEFLRLIPGRLSGETLDIDGKRGYVLTLQTREQHIKRDRATSNICTNQALCALASTVYLSALGENGIKEVAKLSVQKAHYLEQELTNLSGIKLKYSSPFFNEFVITLPIETQSIIQPMYEKGFLAGIPLSAFSNEDKNSLLIAVTEKRTKQELDSFVKAFSELVIS